jgi:hypothetical protein
MMIYDDCNLLDHIGSVIYGIADNKRNGNSRIGIFTNNRALVGYNERKHTLDMAFEPGTSSMMKLSEVLKQHR